MRFRQVGAIHLRTWNVIYEITNAKTGKYTCRKIRKVGDIMEMNEYQKEAKRTAKYPRRTELEGLFYVTLGLAGEAGEIANKVKKILRDDNGIITAVKRSELMDEAGDCLWYLSQLVEELGDHLAWAARANLDKLNKRMREGTIKGSGDFR